MQTKHEIGVTSGEFIINQSDEKNRVISEFKNSQNIPGHGGGHEYVKLD